MDKQAREGGREGGRQGHLFGAGQEIEKWRPDSTYSQYGFLSTNLRSRLLSLISKESVSQQRDKKKMGAAGTVLLCCLAQIFLLTNSFKIGRVRHSFG